ncbi:MAG: TetR/AcrR family transcriptional regulator [Hyphomonadaceae bacterium]|nr:TetR/AcrR family transcriptional regulator [Hyphomonadaceae bacterium]
MPDTKPKSKKGQRSSEQSRAAILQATREEMAEHGWRKFSVDKVSRKAKASKQTIYRWWPAIGNMCIEAALDLVPEASKLGRDPVERISALIQPLEDATRQGSGHAVLRAAMIAASDDKDAGETWRTWLKDHIRAPLRLILAEIAAKKVVRRDFDLDQAVDFLTGQIWARVMIMRAPLPERFSQTQAAALIKSLAP